MDRLHFQAVIFDLDGVITRTAQVHASAWKMLFDDWLRLWSARNGRPFLPFRLPQDYLDQVDGKPRYEGVRSFLASRAIKLPYGEPGDPPGADSICGLGNAKDALFQQALQREGVRVYASTLALIDQLRDSGARVAVVSSSRNCAQVLEAAGISARFDTRVDGVQADADALKGKPDPDIFLACAAKLGVAPAASVVVEDAISGVQAGRAGKFGLVIGVNRANQRAALLENGADLVVDDLAEISMEEIDDWFRRGR